MTIAFKRWFKRYKRCVNQGAYLMKYGFILLFLFCVISNTYASTDCLQKPSCEELGYVQTRKQCTCFEKDVLPCPFNIKDDNTVFCGDLNCKGRCKDTSSLYNGEINTKLYVESWGSRMLAPYAASLFYIGDKGGDFGQGKWWLPSIGEWMDLYGTDVNKMTAAKEKSGATGENIALINSSISALQSKGAAADEWETGGYWSSTLNDSQRTWLFYPETGRRSMEWSFEHGRYMRVVSGVSGLSIVDTKPKIGDVIYLDKTFSSADAYNSFKTPIGIIFAVSDSGKDVKFIGLRNLTFSHYNTLNNFDMDNPYGGASKVTSWRNGGGMVDGVLAWNVSEFIGGFLSACGCPCEFDQCYQQNCVTYNDDCSCKTCVEGYELGSGQCVLGNCQELCLDAKELYDGYGVTYLNVEKIGKNALVPYAASQFYVGKKRGDFGQGKWYIPAIGEWADIYGANKVKMTSFTQGMVGNNISWINNSLSILQAADSEIAQPFDLDKSTPSHLYFTTYDGSNYIKLINLKWGENPQLWKHETAYIRVALIVQNVPQLAEFPKIGDVMYTDKSYGSADNYDGSRTPAGIVFAVSEDGKTVKIIGLRDLTFSSTDKADNFDPENPYGNTTQKIRWALAPYQRITQINEIVPPLQKSGRCSCEFE